MDAGAVDAELARSLVAERRAVVAERLAETERRLRGVRAERGDWTDEEHDPEGFALTFEWSRLEGSREEAGIELRELDRADARIDSGDYGRCERCGRAIPVEQLRRRPARTVCVACTDARR